jgi:hypothetical protein
MMVLLWAERQQQLAVDVAAMPVTGAIVAATWQPVLGWWMEL